MYPSVFPCRRIRFALHAHERSQHRRMHRSLELGARGGRVERARASARRPERSSGWGIDGGRTGVEGAEWRGAPRDVCRDVSCPSFSSLVPGVYRVSRDERELGMRAWERETRGGISDFRSFATVSRPGSRVRTGTRKYSARPRRRTAYRGPLVSAPWPSGFERADAFHASWRLGACRHGHATCTWRRDIGMRMAAYASSERGVARDVASEEP